MVYLIDCGDGCIDDFAFKGFEYDCLVFDCEFCETDAGDYFACANVYFLVIEDTDYVAVLSGAGSLDVGEEFMFEVSAHIWPKEGGMEG
jgi:hypothetical protein